jgi:hypothetical protein
MKKKNGIKLLSLLSVFSLLTYSLGLAFLMKPAYAAGLTLTFGTPEVAVSDTANIVLTFTPVTAVTNGSTIDITWPSSYTGGASLLDADITVAGTNIDSAAESNLTATGFTTTLTTSADVTTAITITIGGTNQLTTPATAGNYSFAVITSVGDYGAALQYVGNDNDVTVSAVVSPLLSFAIRSTADDADTNACALGYLNLTSVSSCSYRLKVTTNAGLGYSVSVTTDGDLRKNGGTGDVADADDITPVTEDSTVSAGNEGYGIAFAGGSTTNGSITASGDFSDDDTPLPLAATTLYSSSGPNNPSSTDTTNTALVTHRAAASGATGTGNYTQLVTYTVTASF